MCLRNQCAFRSCCGECRMTHESCHGDGICRSGVRRATPHRKSVKRRIIVFDLATREGRFRHRTSNVRGAVVYRMCTRKLRYPDEYEARRRGRARSRCCGISLRVYECPFCGGYHLTSKIDVREACVA